MMGTRIAVVLMLTVLSSVCALPAVAESVSSEQQLLQQLKKINSDNSIDLLAARPLIEQIQVQAMRNGWLEADIAATADLAYLLVLIGDVDATERALKQFQRFEPNDVDKQSRRDILATRLNLAVIRQQHAEFTQLKSEARKQLHALELAGEFELQSYLLLDLGNNMVAMEQYQDAMDTLKQASRLFQQFNDEVNFANAKNSLANLYGRMGNHQLALKLYFELLEQDVTQENSIDHSITLYNIGDTYNWLKQYDQADKYLQMARALSVEINDDIGIAFADMRLTQMHLNLKQYPQALEQLQYPVSVFTEQQELSQYLSTLRYKTGALIGLGELDQAALTLRQLENALSRHGIDKSHNYYLLSYGLAEALQQPQAAISAYKTYTDMMVASAENARETSMQKLLAEFGADQAALEKSWLEQGNKLQQVQLNKATNDVARLYLVGVIALLLVVLIVLFWLRERASRHQLQKMASQDFLTGAPNRRAVMEYAHKCLNAALRSGQPLSLAIIDLDHFKQVNDRYGHNIGDRVLQQFSTICAEELRNEDQYGRFGGEEWLLVFPTTAMTNLTLIYERLKTRLRQVKIEGVDDSLEFTFSMGAAQWNRDFSDLDELIKAADSNVYKAKQQGRDRLVIPACCN